MQYIFVQTYAQILWNKFKQKYKTYEFFLGLDLAQMCTGFNNLARTYDRNQYHASNNAYFDN